LASSEQEKPNPQTWEMQKIVLSNRSQSYLKLKKYQEAESDADAALGFDSEHIKSIQRRGTARYYLGKYRLSLKDFFHAQSLQPTQQISEYQKKVIEKMDKIRTEMLEKMKRKGHMLLN
jgi:tetratricopeptide (TPR) repeat protein